MALATATRGTQMQLVTPPKPPPRPSSGGTATSGKTIDMDAYRSLSSYLTSVGLGALFSYENGVPGGWLADLMRRGYDTEDELIMQVESTDVWRDRFGVIVEQRKRAAEGQPVQVMSVKQVIAWETTAAEVMRQAGLPDWFYDSYKDFQKPILNNMSPAEFEERVMIGVNRVRNVDPSIRRAFSDFYGVGNGDSALVAFFLDPQRTMESINRVQLAAYAGGMARQRNINLSRTQAEEFYRQSMTEGGVQQTLGEISGLGSLYRETFGESSNFTAEAEGFEAVVMGNADARRNLSRRTSERRAINQSSQGGAALTNQGLVGVRTV
jgi:hypothetical protein